jgi:GH25 family lysozyme M1 (1,4-beta-N-acetylmuramidase)
MILGIDVSRWQSTVNWETIKAAGVEFAFIKATQGNYLVDAKMKTHVDGAQKAGLIVGLYHWCDPLVKADVQAKFFLDNTKGIDYRFVSADVEQQWGDWKEWSEGRVSKILSPDQISNNARDILGYWESRMSVKRVVYTRASFINSYAKPAQKWLKEYPLWLAHYPYKAGNVRTSWADLQVTYKPSIPGPNLPTGCPNWTFWQFSGDKFILPGIESTLDVNYFNGNLSQLREFAGLPPLPTTPPVETRTVEERLTLLENLAREHGWKV